MGIESEATLSLVMKARNLASSEVDRLHGSMTRLRGGVGKLGHALKLLTTIGVVGLAAGLVGVVGFLGAATKASAEEQVGINRLSAALKANVKGFKGNTDAIEKTISKREQLGFSDDSLRDSLSSLVTKFHSVAKAQHIQAVAMDVARLKGISLKDATALVSKGMDGSVKVLKQLGIELPKTATQHEILIAIQKKAAGQAKAYGETAAGAQEAFGIAIGDVVEDIGSGLVPIMTQAFTWMRTDAIPAVRGVIGAISKWMDQNRPLINQIREGLIKFIGIVIEKVRGVVDWIGKVVTAITSNKAVMKTLGTIFEAIGTFVGLVFDNLGKVIDIIGRVVGAITANKTIMGAFAKVWDVIATAIGGVISVLKSVLGWVGDAITAIDKLLGKQEQVGYVDSGGAGITGHGGPGRGGNPSGHAKGGWAGLHGPELSWLGEKGPEYVIPNHELNGGGGGGVRIQGISERELMDMVDRGLYFRLRRAGTVR